MSRLVSRKRRPWRRELDAFERVQVACLEAVISELRAAEIDGSVYAVRLHKIRNRACQRARIRAGDHSSIRARRQNAIPERKDGEGGKVPGRRG